jgi:hypothetical protein
MRRASNRILESAEKTFSRMTSVAFCQCGAASSTHPDARAHLLSRRIAVPLIQKQLASPCGRTQII